MGLPLTRFGEEGPSLEGDPELHQSPHPAAMEATEVALGGQRLGTGREGRDGLQNAPLGGPGPWEGPAFEAGGRRPFRPAGTHLPPRYLGSRCVLQGPV